MGQLGHLSPQGSVAIGILVGLVSTSVQSLGLTLQRKSHILEDDKAVDEYRRPPFRRRRWQLGMLMFIVSNLAGSTVQITTLPLPVLSTLQASGLVFNSICATLILGEPFTRWSLGGTILVCVGAILIAIFGAIPEPAHNLNQLLILLRREQFVIWMIAQAILVASVISIAEAIKYMNPRTHHSPRLRLFRGMAYGGVSGILSAHSLLVAKSAVELLVRTIVDRNNQFNRWQSWMILLGLLGLALTQLYYLHHGLKLCSTSILYPFVFCIYNIIAILDGLIYFDQSSRLTLLHGLLIALGTVILLSGVLALSWRLSNDPATRPPVAQNPLTPGLGLVEDDISDTDSMIATSGPDEESALLGKEIDYQSIREPNSASKPHGGLVIERHRTRPNTEADLICIEQDDNDIVGSLPSPYIANTKRRTSALRSTSNQSSKRNSRVSFENAVRSNDESDSSPAVNKLIRSSTGRTYRKVEPHRRRATISHEGREQHRHRQRTRSTSSQDALGGWWKMQWWGIDREDSPISKGKSRGPRPRPASVQIPSGNGAEAIQIGASDRDRRSSA